MRFIKPLSFLKEVFLFANYHFRKVWIYKLITIKNLSKTYKSSSNDVQALKNINLSIPKGTIHGIIGLSGAGKSTLVRCVNRLEEPSTGEIYIDGVDILNLHGKGLRNLRKKIGMIFQHFNLLNNKTIYDNIAFPLRLDKVPENKIKERVSYLLDLVELTDKSSSYPSELSGGQKQRVGIARALANEPYILLCDEATSALDPKTTKQILNLLKEINKKLNLTMILITHEMEVIKEICDSVSVLEYGEIVEENNVISIFSNPSSTQTKTLISQEFNIPKELKDKYMLSIHFNETTSLTPIIYNLIKDIDVKVNIICGNIDFIKHAPIGNLLVEVASEAELNKVVDYLNSKNITSEVIKYE